MKLFGWALYFAFLAAIVVVGWEQPLKVKFGLKAMTQAAPVVPTQPGWMNDGHRWDNARNSAPPPTVPAQTTRP